MNSAECRKSFGKALFMENSHVLEDLYNEYIISEREYERLREAAPSLPPGQHAEVSGGRYEQTPPPTLSEPRFLMWIWGILDLRAGEEPIRYRLLNALQKTLRLMPVSHNCYYY